MGKASKNPNNQFVNKLKTKLKSVQEVARGTRGEQGGREKAAQPLQIGCLAIWEALGKLGNNQKKNSKIKFEKFKDQAAVPLERR